MASFAQSHPLDNGASFPRLSLNTTGETAISLPGTSDGFTVVLVYRGKW